MPSFRAACGLLALLAYFDLSSFVFASPTPQPESPLPRAAVTAAGAAAAKPSGAVLSPSAQLLVNRTVASQRATGQKWDLLAAEALLKLVAHVETHGWPSRTCNLDNAHVRREW
jgi:hypothetical protein